MLNKAKQKIATELVYSRGKGILNLTHKSNFTKDELWFIEQDYAETDEDGYGLYLTAKGRLFI